MSLALRPRPRPIPTSPLVPHPAARYRRDTERTPEVKRRKPLKTNARRFRRFGWHLDRDPMAGPGPALRRIRGGRDPELRLGSTRVVAAPRDLPPFGGAFLEGCSACGPSARRGAARRGRAPAAAAVHGCAGAVAAGRILFRQLLTSPAGSRKRIVRQSLTYSLITAHRALSGVGQAAPDDAPLRENA